MDISHSPDTDGGFTIIEMLICICLISIALLGVSQMQIGSMKTNQRSASMMIANQESSAAADLLLGMEFGSSDLVDGTTKTLPSSSGVTIQYTVTDISPFNSSESYHSILLTTTWNDSAGSHSLQRIFTKLP